MSPDGSLDFWGLPYLPLASRLHVETFNYAQHVGFAAFRHDGAKVTVHRVNKPSRVQARVDDYEAARILTKELLRPPYLAYAAAPRYQRGAA